MLALADLDVDEARTFHRLRRRIWMATLRHEAWRVRHGMRPSIVSDPGALGSYLAHRWAAFLGRPPGLHGSLAQGATSAAAMGGRVGRGGDRE